MYAFKKLIAPFVTPMSLCLGIALLGLLLLVCTPRQKTGKVLICTGFALLYLFSLQPVSDALVRPLERQYPYADPDIWMPWIVVLGGGSGEDEQLPPVSQLTDASVKRLVEGVTQYHEHPGSRLVFTGRNIAGIMADLACQLGVEERDIVIEDRPRDTREEARHLKEIVKDSPFLLITSASHMPRAVALIRKNGLQPIPVPSRHLIRDSYKLKPGLFLPSAGSLYKTERAWYEYLGLAWAWLRGQI